MAPRKKNAEQLSLERIVETAMRIIDSDGLDALSMRRISSELGVNPMAAYHYIPNKAALYDLVLDKIMMGVDLSKIAPKAPLEERIKQFARAFRAALLVHPRAIPVMATRSVRSAIAMRPIEPGLGLLFEGGLNSLEALAAVDAIAHYILGGTMGYYHHVIEKGDWPARDFEEFSPEEFPNVTRTLKEGRYVGFEEEFEFGLDALIRGLLSGPRYQIEET